MKISDGTHVFLNLLGYFTAAFSVVLSLHLAVDSVGAFSHRDFVRMTLFLTVAVSVVAAPIAVPFIFIAERKRIRSAFAFAGAGLLVGLLAFVLVNFLMGWPDVREMDEANAVILIAGLSVGVVKVLLIMLTLGVIGGLTYWAIAGRHSGDWNSNQ